MNTDKNARCLELLENSGQPPHVIDHCKAVAEVSYKLALALNEKGFSLDAELCRRGGLLHDICRTEQFHSFRGLLYVIELGGLRPEALIVGAHMGEYIDTDRIAEKEVVYMADKITKGTGRVDVAERYARSIEKFHGSEEAMQAAYERRDQSLALAAYMESFLGKPIHEFDM